MYYKNIIIIIIIILIMLVLTNNKILRISKCIGQYFSRVDEQVLRPLHLPKTSNPTDIFNYVSSKCKHFTITEKDLKSQRVWMKECIPTLKRNTDEIIKKQMIGDLFLFYLRIKLNWNDLIHIGSRCLTDSQIKQLNLTQLIHVYTALVELRYDKDINYVGRIREEIQQKMENLPNIEGENIQNFLKYLQLLILDKNIKKQLKNNLIGRIVQKCIRNPQNLSNISEAKGDKISILSSLYEEVKVYEIQIHQSLLNIFQTANNEIDQYIEKNPKNSGALKTMSKFLKQDKFKSKIIDQSIFQIIFEKKLREIGYVYNVFHIIKGNQYDFLITSKNKHKFLPLKNIDLGKSIDEIKKQNCKPFSKSLLKQLNECEQQQYVHKSENLAQKVIINLNGPHHYIESDIIAKNSICRKQQFKNEKLQLYGNYRFNSVNFQEWEKISVYDQLSKQFIQKLIQQAKTVKKPNL